jgi:hypothetical protein
MAAKPKEDPSTEMVTVSKADLAAMIAEALQAREDNKPTAPPPGMELAEAIGNAVADGMAKHSPKKVTFGAYMKRPTKQHPLGLAGPQFERQYFQNGLPVPYESVTDDVVNELNKLTHSGRYLDRKVEVIIRDEGADNQTVDIRWNNASQDNRMELKSLFSSFLDCLRKINAVQVEERAEEEESPRRVVRRPFGSGKNTRAAEEAAGS